MNRVELLGRLTKAPELKQTQSGTMVTNFTIAVNRRFAKEGQQQADFINCIAWRKTAEFISKYFTKGSMIAVTGSIQSRSWDDQNGQKRYATEIIVDGVYFTGEKPQNGGYDGDYQNNNQFPADNPFPTDDYGDYQDTDYDEPPF